MQQAPHALFVADLRPALRAVLGALLLAERAADLCARRDLHRLPPAQNHVQAEALRALSRHAGETVVTLEHIAATRLVDASFVGVLSGEDSGAMPASSSFVAALRRGTGLMVCLLELAELGGDDDLAEDCARWLTTRDALVTAIERSATAGNERQTAAWLRVRRSSDDVMVG